MLTEKEKEAVEKLDYFNKLNFIYTISVEKIKDYQEYSKVILNLVTKLQDEVIKLLKENRELIAITNNYKAYEIPFTDEEDKIIIASKKYFVNGFFKNNFISKALIERKINEYEYLINDFEITDNSGRFKKENSINYYKLEALKELLKEGESDEKL